MFWYVQIGGYLEVTLPMSGVQSKAVIWCFTTSNDIITEFDISSEWPSLSTYHDEGPSLDSSNSVYIVSDCERSYVFVCKLEDKIRWPICPTIYFFNKASNSWDHPLWQADKFIIFAQCASYSKFKKSQEKYVLHLKIRHEQWKPYGVDAMFF